MPKAKRNRKKATKPVTVDIADRRLYEGTGEGQLNPAIVQKERERLVVYYKLRIMEGTNGRDIKSDKDVIITVTNAVRKAINGYPRAAMKYVDDDKSKPLLPEETFIARLAFITRYKMRSDIWIDNPRQLLEKSPKQIQEDMLINEEDIVELKNVETGKVSYAIDVPFAEVADKDEADFLRARRAYYEKEFEFNKSSDLIILEGLLIDELVLKRISSERLSRKVTTTEDIDDIQKRIRETMKVLGISRQQRMASNSSQKGNIAELSSSLNGKLEEIIKLRDKDTRDALIVKILTDYTHVSKEDLANLAEELQMMRERLLRSEIITAAPVVSINEIPSPEDIKQHLEAQSRREKMESLK